VEWWLFLGQHPFGDAIIVGSRIPKEKLSQHVVPRLDYRRTQLGGKRRLHLIRAILRRGREHANIGQFCGANGVGSRWGRQPSQGIKSRETDNKLRLPSAAIELLRNAKDADAVLFTAERDVPAAIEIDHGRHNDGLSATIAAARLCADGLRP
jgi:hypothetical protein